MRKEKGQIKVVEGNRARKSQRANYTHTHTHNQKAKGSSVKIEKLPCLLLKLKES